MVKDGRKVASKDDKILKFDRSEKRLADSMQKRLDAGDGEGALTLGYRWVEFFAPCVDAYAMLADAYEMLEANAQAVKIWYRFLDMCEEDCLGEAYEGLAVNYMNLGRDSQAAYYYNLLLQVDDDISEESKMEIVETFSKPHKSLFRTVYPPEKADYTPELEAGLEALKKTDYAAAEEAFSAVEKGSRQYSSAQNLIAVSYLLQGNNEGAKALCERLILENPEDVQANTTYAAVLGQMGMREKAKEVAKKLYTLPASDSDELYKIATVCCENELHKEALKKFCELENEVQNDRMLLYFKAVAAYKSGEYALSIKTFERLLTLYPEASVARYYYDILRLWLENKDKEDIQPPPTTYFYSLPKEMSERYCDLLVFLNKLTRAEAATIMDNPQIRVVLDWAFDEADETDETRLLAMHAAVRCGYDSFVRDILLDPEVSDLIKIRTLQLLLMRNEENIFGVVLYNVYRRVKLRRVKTGVKKRKKFLEAFSSVYSKFGILSDRHGRKICAASELLYRCLLAADKADWLDAVNDVSAAIYLLAGLKEGGGTLKAAVEFFGAEEENTKRILEEVKRVTNEVMQAATREQTGKGAEKVKKAEKEDDDERE